MTNKDFWDSIDSIIDEGFSPDGLKTLEIYANKFIAGQLVYKRFSSFEQHGCSNGGALNVIASLLAGAEIATDKLAAPEGSFKREQQRAETQVERLECWVSGSSLVAETISEGLRFLRLILNSTRTCVLLVFLRTTTSDIRVLHESCTSRDSLTSVCSSLPELRCKGTAFSNTLFHSSPYL